MTTRIHAIYRHGVFRPTEPVGLEDGAAVELTISTDIPVGNEAAPSREIAQTLKAIASLPAEGPDDLFSGGDHDAVLYREGTEH